MTLTETLGVHILMSVLLMLDPKKLPNSTSQAVQKEFSVIISEFATLLSKSDNGPCYSAEDFKFFLQDLSIEQHMISYHFSQ